jgi:hypothetical protein
MQLFKLLLILWALVGGAASSNVCAQSTAKYATADYTGRWVLDTSQSKSLPPFYSNIRSHTLEISQHDGKLLVTVLIENKEGGSIKMELPYNLDGSDVMSTTTMRSPQGDVQVPTKLNAVVGQGGGLHITLSREMEMNGEKFNAVTNEDWRLAGDGKSIVIHRMDDTPRGKIDAEMVFVKQ